MTRPLTLLLPAVITLAGCSREPAQPEPAAIATRDAAPQVIAVPATAAAPDVAAPAAAADGAPILVWGADDEGVESTFWIARTSDGLEVTEATGTVIAIDGALYHFVIEEEALPTSLDCESLELDGHGEGTGSSVFLDRVGGGEHRDVIGADAVRARSAADYQEQTTLLGSLGPYLFLDRSVYTYDCGAHGGIEHEHFVIDGRTGNPVELIGEHEAVALGDSMLARARAALVEESEGESLMFGDEVTLTLSTPVIGADGVVRMSHQWTGETCYACSDGEWDSYTVSTQLETDVLPAKLAPYAEGISEPLRWLSSEVPGFHARGVSRPDPAQRAAFETLGVEGC